MTAEEFRILALSCVEAIEAGHMGKADFRVRKKIFATLDAEDGLCTLKLDAEQQALVITVAGTAAWPANGAWGARGWTKIDLASISSADMASWLRMAWRGIAPKTLLRQVDIPKEVK